MLNELTEVETNLSTEYLLVKSYSLPHCDLHQLQQSDTQAFPFLVESVAVSDTQTNSNANIAQYSILFAYPKAPLVLSNREGFDDFQTKFQADFNQNKVTITSPLPFTGGWFCYFSYDYAQVVEPSLSLPSSELPLAILTRVACAYIYDHLNQQLHLVAEVGFEDEFRKMQTPLGTFSWKNDCFPVNKIEPAFIQEEDEGKYLAGIEQIKEYILSGDIFQVNLSRLWQVALEEGKAEFVYALLRQSNPAPFAANVYFEDFQIVSSSPERLVKYDANTNWVETRPIAGTRKRSECKDEDKALVDELINHPKEIAEHIMLIDLERNDLGRICEVGSVEVNELMSVETYQHVHHIVSNVRGKLKRGLTPLDVIHAVFPGGTITGCPKIRCMEIIAELEQMPREAYTGSIGYINRDGSMDTNILIRTFMLKNNIATFRAGAGIVADSVASNELEEARHKAKGLIQSLQSLLE